MQARRGHNYKILCQGFSNIFSGTPLNKIWKFQCNVFKYKTEIGNTGDRGDGLQGVANNTAYQQI